MLDGACLICAFALRSTSSADIFVVGRWIRRALAASATFLLIAAMPFLAAADVPRDDCDFPP